MPQLEIRYSADIEIDTSVLFEKIESTINSLDSSAGVCKARAYPAHSYRHSHVLIDLWLLPKKHRDHAFNQTLLKVLRDVVGKHVNAKCYLSVQLFYRDANYITIE